MRLAITDCCNLRLGTLWLVAFSVAPHECNSQQPDAAPPHRRVLHLDSSSGVELTDTKGMLTKHPYFTVEAWVRASVGQEGWFPLLGDYANGKHPDLKHPHQTGWMMGFGKTSDNSLAFHGRVSDYEVAGSIKEHSGKWSHIAIVNEPDGMSIYHNGRRWSKKHSASNISWHRSPINLHIGPTEYSGLSAGYQVDLGDLRVSSTCLYTNPFNPPTRFKKRSDTLVLLDFTTTTDRRIDDLSEHQHHGMIRGARWIQRDSVSVKMPVHKVVFQRPLGVLNADANFIPRPRRWELQFTTSEREVAARQLDFYKIELGVFGRDEDDVVYVSGLSAEQPTVRSAPGHMEKRLYLTVDNKKQAALIEPLLQQAGVSTSDRTIMCFLDPAFENSLAFVELEYGRRKAKSVQEIENTVFEVHQSGKYPQIKVAQMQLRPKD